MPKRKRGRSIVSTTRKSTTEKTTRVVSKRRRPRTATVEDRQPECPDNLNSCSLDNFWRTSFASNLDIASFKKSFPFLTRDPWFIGCFELLLRTGLLCDIAKHIIGYIPKETFAAFADEGDIVPLIDTPFEYGAGTTLPTAQCPFRVYTRFRDPKNPDGEDCFLLEGERGVIISIGIGHDVNRMFPNPTELFQDYNTLSTHVRHQFLVLQELCAVTGYVSILMDINLADWREAGLDANDEIAANSLSQLEMLQHAARACATTSDHHSLFKIEQEIALISDTLWFTSKCSDLRSQSHSMVFRDGEKAWDEFKRHFALEQKNLMMEQENRNYSQRRRGPVTRNWFDIEAMKGAALSFICALDVARINTPIRRLFSVDYIQTRRLVLSWLRTNWNVSSNQGPGLM